MPSLCYTSIGSSNNNVVYLSDNDFWVDDHLAIQHSRACLIVRAYLAYLRHSPFDPDDDSRFSELPSESFSHTCCDEKTNRGYVCLGGATGRLLAVFRIDSRQKLKRLRRYPAFVTALFGKEQRLLRPPAVKHKKLAEGGIKLQIDPAVMAWYREATRPYRIGIA